jgi:outer membrane protein assembly factor BamE
MPLLLLKKSRHLVKVLVATSALLVMSACATKQAVTTGAATDANAGTQIVKPSGFDSFFGFITPYRITVQQGNFVSQEMVTQLKQGMTREQVRFLLGTALLTDMFHEDRWDYPFRLLKPNGEVVSSRIAIFFKNNTVERFDGGNLPTEKEYLAHITTSAIAVRNESELNKEAPKKKQ